ncbi:MAG TPA: class I SAM-dependent methyltransferase [Caulobacteraceae bacterium]|jgi:2-polyprenyl-3-methyl-5-hydroxy-6-metoxy-1,4-benzoquinol methylase
MPASSDRSPFAGTAAYYAKFRAPYAPAALDWVVETFALTDKDRVLDLGCGPGILAIPLSRTVAEVIAVDPDAEMIAEGQRLAEREERRNVRWLNVRAEKVPADAGPFKITTIGQAFHWMVRDAVLARLAVLIRDGGGLALVNPGKRRPQEIWELTAAPIVAQYLGPPTRHPNSNPQEPEHEPALRRSSHFSHFTTREFPGAITRDIPSILGFIYSISSSARPLFGDRAGAFEAELSEALLRLNPTGAFEERIETEVLIAPKKAR